MPRTRHGAGSVSRGSHTGGSLTDFRSPGGALIGNPVWGTNVTSDDGSLGLVTALEVTPGSIGPGDLVPGTVVGEITPGSITGTHVAGDTISAANIAANTITAAEIAANTITANEIASSTITADEIAANTITAYEIAAGTITADEIAANTITADELAAGAVTATDIFGTTITGLSFHAGGSAATQINVYDSSSNLIGYWDTAGLHLAEGKFFMSDIQLRIAVSNNVSFWDFEGRAIRAPDGVVTFAYAGAVSDYNMAYMTLNGALGVDSYNGRMYFRYGGSWHYATQDAGFTVPAHETICPVCELPLLPGQDLIGRGDRLRDDGSLHALYIHFTCAGTPMNQTIADEYDAIANHVDLDADPVAKDKHEKDLAKLLKKATDAQKGK